MNPEKEKALDEAHIQATIKSRDVSQDAFDAMKEKLSADSRQLSENPERSYQPKITINTSQKDSKVTNEIKDNGSGIPDDIINKILQPFFTCKKGTEGTWLGLYISNDIIKAHEEIIEIESSEGEGSTFSIHLPHLIKQPS